MAGLRQQDLADELGMAQSTYAYKEATGTFDESERKRIAKILNVDMALIVWTKTSTGKVADEKDKIIQQQRDRILQLEADVKRLEQMIDKLLENR